MTSESDLRARVERGATFLDQAEPYWWKRVEDELYMWSGCDCVLGQMFGDYQCGVTRLVGEYDEDWAVERGFTSLDGEWAALDRLWLEAIEARRADPDRYVP